MNAPNRDRGRCTRGVPRSGFPYPEASWTTSGPLTQGHRPLDDKLRGRHCISGSAPAPSLAVSLPVSIRSWGGGVSVLRADVLLGGHLVPAQGCLAMEPCPGDLGLVLDTLEPLQPFLVPDPSSHAAGVCTLLLTPSCAPCAHSVRASGAPWAAPGAPSVILLSSRRECPLQNRAGTVGSGWGGTSCLLFALSFPHQSFGSGRLPRLGVPEQFIKLLHPLIPWSPFNDRVH